MLTTSKEAIAGAAYAAARNAIQNHPAMGYNGYNLAPGSVMGQLTDLIALAIMAGVREVLDNLYTNEEFEKDIGLSSDKTTL